MTVDPPSPQLKARRPFLTARWANLLLVTFPVPEELVRRVIHPALEPDRWEDHALVSLVAFEFMNTRIKGCRIPRFSTFPEVNLRTYVRHAFGRGVVFIQELVPSRLVALVARARYNEPYHAIAMSSRTRSEDGAIVVTHRFGRYRLRVTGSKTTTTPAVGSLEHFIKEHEWGFGKRRDGKLLQYRVDHPVWCVRQIQHIDYDVDFRALYGTRWGFLNQRTPLSTIFAVGSEVSVYPPRLVH